MGLYEKIYKTNYLFKSDCKGNTIFLNNNSNSEKKTKKCVIFLQLINNLMIVERCFLMTPCFFYKNIVKCLEKVLNICFYRRFQVFVYVSFFRIVKLLVAFG